MKPKVTGVINPAGQSKNTQHAKTGIQAQLQGALPHRSMRKNDDRLASKGALPSSKLPRLKCCLNGRLPAQKVYLANDVAKQSLFRRVQVLGPGMARVPLFWGPR